MGLESTGVVRFDLRPLLQGQTRIAKLKMLITRLFILFLRISAIFLIVMPSSGQKRGTCGFV